MTQHCEMCDGTQADCTPCSGCPSCADLQAKLEALQMSNVMQLAGCDCAAMLDTQETHEQAKKITKDNPYWSPAYESVMRRTAECINLRAKLETAERALAKACGIVEGT